MDLLALTAVVETRSLARYEEHAARPRVDARTRSILRTVVSDERWHLAWVQRQLASMTENDPSAQQRVRSVTERYAAIEEEVYQELIERERCLFADRRGGNE